MCAMPNLKVLLTQFSSQYHITLIALLLPMHKTIVIVRGYIMYSFNLEGFIQFSENDDLYEVAENTDPIMQDLKAVSQLITHIPDMVINFNQNVSMPAKKECIGVAMFADISGEYAIGGMVGAIAPTHFWRRMVLGIP